MKQLRVETSVGSPKIALIATAIGAVAVGAFAIGALAIGRLAVRRLAVENGRFKSLEIDDLTVKRLHAAEVNVSESLRLPAEFGAQGALERYRFLCPLQKVRYLTLLATNANHQAAGAGDSHVTHIAKAGVSQPVGVLRLTVGAAACRSH